MLSRIWFITGTSSGLGRELVKTVLSRGDKVIATARSLSAIQDLQSDRCHITQLDVTDTFDQLRMKASEAISIWGRVDVLVNNAGHGLFGLVEEAGVEGLMEIYKTNVFGVVNVTNAFLPHMRERRNGTVVVIGSRSGWRTQFPMNAYYGSSKAAVHAIADSLSEELRPFGIQVITVVPGGLRTKGISNMRFIENPMGVPEYAALRSKVRKYFDTTNGKESGDAVKAAKAIVDSVRGEGMSEGKPQPGSLYLGSDAKRDVSARCEAILKNLSEWEDVAVSIDVDE